MANTRPEVQHTIAIDFKNLPRTEQSNNLYEVMETSDSIIVQLNQSHQHYDIQLGDLARPGKSLIITGGTNNTVSISNSNLNFHDISLTANNIVLENSTSITTESLQTQADVVTSYAQINTGSMETFFSEHGTGFKNAGALTVRDQYLQIYGAMINEKEFNSGTVQISNGGLVLNKVGARWVCQSQQIDSATYINDGYASAGQSEINSNNILINGFYKGDNWRFVAASELVTAENSRCEVEDVHCESQGKMSIAGCYSKVDQLHLAAEEMAVTKNASFRQCKVVRFEAAQTLDIEDGAKFWRVKEVTGTADEINIKTFMSIDNKFHFHGLSHLEVESGKHVSAREMIFESKHVSLQKDSVVGKNQKGVLTITGILVEALGELEPRLATLKADILLRTSNTTKSNAAILTMKANNIELDGIYDGDTLHCDALKHLYLMISLILNVKNVKGGAPVATLAGAINSGLLVTADIIDNHAVVTSTGNTKLIAHLLLANSTESKVNSSNVRMESKTILNEGEVNGTDTVHEKGGNVFHGNESSTASAETTILSVADVRLAGEYYGHKISVQAKNNISAQPSTHMHSDKLKIAAGNAVSGPLTFDSNQAKVVGVKSVSALAGKMNAKDKLKLHTNDLHLNNTIGTDHLLMSQFANNNGKDTSRVMTGEQSVTTAKVVEEQFNYSQFAGVVDSDVTRLSNKETTVTDKAAFNFDHKLTLSTGMARLNGKFTGAGNKENLLEAAAPVPPAENAPANPEQKGMFVAGQDVKVGKTASFDKTPLLNFEVQNVALGGDYSTSALNVRANRTVLTEDAHVKDTTEQFNIIGLTPAAMLEVREGSRVNAQKVQLYNIQLAIIKSQITANEVVAKLKDLIITKDGKLGNANSKVSIETERMELYGLLEFSQATIKCYESYYQYGADVKGTNLAVTAPIYQSYLSVIQAQQFTKTTAISIDLDVKFVNWLTEVSFFSVSAFPRLFHPTFLLKSLQDIKDGKISLKEIFTIQNTLQGVLAIIKPFAPRLVSAINVAVSTYFIGKTIISLAEHAKTIDTSDIRFADTLPLLVGLKNIGISAASAVSSVETLINDLKQPTLDAFADPSKFFHTTIPSELEKMWHLPTIDQALAVGAGLAGVIMPAHTRDAVVDFSFLELGVIGTLSERSALAVNLFSPKLAVNDLQIAGALVDFSPHLALNQVISGIEVVKGGPDVALNLSISATDFKQVAGIEVASTAAFAITHMTPVNTIVRDHTAVTYTDVAGKTTQTDENALLGATGDFSDLNPTSSDATAGISYVKTTGDIAPPSQTVTGSRSFTGDTVTIKPDEQLNAKGTLAFTSKKGDITNAGTEKADTIIQNSAKDIVQNGATTVSRVLVTEATDNFISGPRDYKTRITDEICGVLIAEKSAVNSSNTAEYVSNTTKNGNIVLTGATINATHTATVNAADGKGKVILNADYSPSKFDKDNKVATKQYLVPAAVVGGDGEGSADNKTGVVIIGSAVESTAGIISAKANTVVIAKEVYEAKPITWQQRVYSNSHVTFTGVRTKTVNTTVVRPAIVESTQGDVIVVAGTIDSQSGTYAAHGNLTILTNTQPHFGTTNVITTVHDSTSLVVPLSLTDIKGTQSHGQIFKAGGAIVLQTNHGDLDIADSKFTGAAAVFNAVEGTTRLSATPGTEEITTKQLGLTWNIGIAQGTLYPAGGPANQTSVQVPLLNAIDAVENSKTGEEKAGNEFNVANQGAVLVNGARNHDPLAFVGNSAGVGLTYTTTHTTRQVPGTFASLDVGAVVDKSGNGFELNGISANIPYFDEEGPAASFNGVMLTSDTHIESAAVAVSLSPQGLSESASASHADQHAAIASPSQVNIPVLELKNGATLNVQNANVHVGELRGTVKTANVTSVYSDIKTTADEITLSNGSGSSVSHEQDSAHKVLTPASLTIDKMADGASIKEANLTGGILQGDGIASHPPEHTNNTPLTSTETQSGFTASGDALAFTNTTTQSVTGHPEVTTGFKMELQVPTALIDLINSAMKPQPQPQQDNASVAADLDIDEAGESDPTDKKEAKKKEQIDPSIAINGKMESEIINIPMNGIQVDDVTQGDININQGSATQNMGLYTEYSNRANQTEQDDSFNNQQAQLGNDTNNPITMNQSSIQQSNNLDISKPPTINERMNQEIIYDPMTSMKPVRIDDVTKGNININQGTPVQNMGLYNTYANNTNHSLNAPENKDYIFGQIGDIMEELNTQNSLLSVLTGHGLNGHRSYRSVISIKEDYEALQAAWHKSRETGDYSYVFDESARITKNWVVTGTMIKEASKLVITATLSEEIAMIYLTMELNGLVSDRLDYATNVVGDLIEHPKDYGREIALAGSMTYQSAASYVNSNSRLFSPGSSFTPAAPVAGLPVVELYNAGQNISQAATNMANYATTNASSILRESRAGLFSAGSSLIGGVPVAGIYDTAKAGVLRK